MDEHRGLLVDGHCVLPKEGTWNPQPGQPPVGIIHSFHKWFSKHLNQEPLLLLNLFGHQRSFNDYFLKIETVQHTQLQLCRALLGDWQYWKGTKAVKDEDCSITSASFNLGELAMSFFSKMCKTASWMVRKNMDGLISSSKNALLSSLSRKPSVREQNQSTKWPAGLKKEEIYPEHAHWVNTGVASIMNCFIY